jgi:hypothetical protein
MEGSIMMQVDGIKLKELTQSEREVLKEDAARWKRMGAGSHLDDWLSYFPGLAIRRRLAMRLAFTNKPEGKGYAQAFGELMKADGLLDPAVKTSFTAVVWLGDDPERMKVLRELREAMPPGQRSRLNSPITARQRVEAILQARRHGVEESVKTSPVALLKEAMVEQAREIVELKQKLAKHEQGSLFDLKHDSADDIASAITGNLSTHKAKSLADGILARLKKSQKPAG